MNIQKLRSVRLSKGVSQTYMAKRLGYKFASGYANIESGRNKPSLEKAKQISELLEVDVEELFFDQKLHIKGNPSTT